MVMTFSTSGRPLPRPSPAETAAERTARLQREADAIALGHAQIDAGHGIEDDALETWLDALDRDPDAPLPAPASQPRR